MNIDNVSVLTCIKSTPPKLSNGKRHHTTVYK
jgi:hypothetical protein